LDRAEEIVRLADSIPDRISKSRLSARAQQDVARE